MKHSINIILILVVLCGCCNSCNNNNSNGKQLEQYTPNREITGKYDHSLAVKCENGTFVGSRKDGILIFKGVPYAVQPTGRMRWRAPQAPEKSDKVYEALHFAHSAMQTVSHDEPAGMYEQGDDMLALNVWTGDLNSKKPVMVFIHGGAFVIGGTADPQ